MRLYLSGNFPQLMNPVKEKAFMESLLKRGYNYNRLITFFYPKHCETILTIIKEKMNESQKS
jgi:hypothetical protein